MLRLHLLRHLPVLVPESLVSKSVSAFIEDDVIVKGKLAQALCYGQSDWPAEKASRAQLDAIISSLPQSALCYSSPLVRCSALASQLWATSEFSLDDRLKELHFGQWEGVLWDDVPRDDLDAWAAAPYEFTMPSGESFAQLVARVKAWLDEALVTAVAVKKEHLIIVTHAGVIRALRVLCEGISPEQALQKSAAFGSVTQLFIRSS